MMTAETINLRRARKAKARVEREAKAEANRRAFGRSRAENAKSAAEHRLSQKLMDGHRREPSNG